MYAIRIVKEYVEKEWFGIIEQLPVYEYFCYCSNLKGLDSKKIHELYGGRAECENWIENTKNQLCAGKTITNDFHVNDISGQSENRVGKTFFHAFRKVSTLPIANKPPFLFKEKEFGACSQRAT